VLFAARQGGDSVGIPVCFDLRAVQGAVPGTPIHIPMYDGIEGKHNPGRVTWAEVDRLKRLT